ncbi:hypothetical protein RRG08_042234 [Elysia crispata]|uniref:Uncharacterized protein n=1 Tax=Elysia crispata TaxID=231223 RepID=A0AAE1E3W5_9GAST|nr:hypothetical protein RRG08_042234 [Elysia crispata]
MNEADFTQVLIVLLRIGALRAEWCRSTPQIRQFTGCHRERVRAVAGSDRPASAVGCWRPVPGEGQYSASRAGNSPQSSCYRLDLTCPGPRCANLLRSAPGEACQPNLGGEALHITGLTCWRKRARKKAKRNLEMGGGRETGRPRDLRMRNLQDRPMKQLAGELGNSDVGRYS